MLRLQRLAGNRAVARSLGSGQPVVQRVLADDLKRMLDAPVPDGTKILERAREAAGAERQQATADAELLATAKAKLGDGYAAFVQTLHVPAELGAQQLSGYESPARAAQDVQGGLKRLFADAIGEEALGGKKIEERMVVLPTATFVTVALSFYPTKKADDFKEISGFNIQDRVFIDAEKTTDIGTLIHESIHLFAPDTFGNELGNELNEGVTEYFARATIAELHLPIARTKYQSQYLYTSAFIEFIGEENVKAAYFKGDVGRLKAAFVAKVGGSEETALRTWDALCKAGEDGATFTQFLFEQKLLQGKNLATIERLAEVKKMYLAVDEQISRVKHQTSVLWTEAQTKHLLGDAWKRSQEVYTGKASYDLEPILTDLRKRPAAVKAIVDRIEQIHGKNADRAESEARAWLKQCGEKPVGLDALERVLRDLPRLDQVPEKRSGGGDVDLEGVDIFG